MGHRFDLIFRSVFASFLLPISFENQSKSVSHFYFCPKFKNLEDEKILRFRPAFDVHAGDFALLLPKIRLPSQRKFETQNEQKRGNCRLQKAKIGAFPERNVQENEITPPKFSIKHATRLPSSGVNFFMNLVLDIGNTRTKAAIFKKNRIVEQAVWHSEPLRNLSIFLKKKRVERCLLSSVAAPDPLLSDWLSERFDFRELDSETLLPFKNQYLTPKTLGKDRLAAVAGAQVLFPRKTVLVVDFGTCIKYEILTADSKYLGGNISPGAAMRLRAMQLFTARLPEATFSMPPSPVGSTTETALQNGGLRGAAMEVEGFIRHFRKHFGVQKVILTGGDASFFQPYLPPEKWILVQPDLVLLGLNAILTFLEHRDADARRL